MGSPVAGNIDANSLTNRVISQMTGFVTQTVTTLVGNRVGDLENSVVKQVTTELRPTVIQVVQATVSSAGIDTSDIGKLLETILVQLRPVVLGAVRIVKELRPFVSEALKKEIAAITVKTQKAQTQVISEVKAELEPAVLKVIESVVGASGVDLNNPQQLVELIIKQLRPVIFNAVIKALKSSPYKNIDPQKLTVRIIIELTPFVESGVQQQVQAVTAQNDDGLIQELIDRLNPAIQNTIKGLQGNNIPQDLADEIVRVTPPKVQGLIKNKVTALALQPGSSSLPDSVFVDRIIADMRGDVIAAIEAVPRYKVVLNKPGFGSLLQRIMAILRDLIQRQLELYRQSLRVVEKPKP